MTASRSGVKYGLIMYKDSPNLGDDIQSYAASHFLPHIDYYIDREDMSSFIPDEAEMVFVILNGWYLYNHTNWPPSDFIFPLLTSLHFDSVNTMYGSRNLEKNYAFDNIGAEFLRQYGPVGCRDFPTLEIMQRHAIPAAFSGCLTLTLEPFLDIEKNDEILLVDICWDERIEAVREKIQKESGQPVSVLSHYMPRPILSNMTYDERLRYVETRLKLYQSAYCVITTRLHCALPCLALGTPVLLIEEKISKNRIGTYYKYFERCTVNDLLNDGGIAFISSPTVAEINWLKFRDELRLLCKNYVRQARDGELSPLLLECRNIARSGIKRHKMLERIAHECAEAQYEVETRLQEMSFLRDAAEKQLQCMHERQRDFENNLDTIQNSISWKLMKHFRKVIDILYMR
jgi:hypothetical protein